MINFNDDTHTYTNDKGDVYISVTQLLKKYNLSTSYNQYIDPAVLANAAGYGKTVHKELEEYIKQGTAGVTPEYTAFVLYTTSNNIDLTTAKSEHVIYNDKYKIAGTLDFSYIDNNEFVIADFKTTSSIHWDSVSWQLSLYNYMCCNYNIIEYYGAILKVFHFDKLGKLKVREVPTIPYEEVEKLLDAYITNSPYSYTPDLSKIMSDTEGQVLYQLCSEINQCELLLKELSTKKQSYQKKLLEKLQTHQIRSCEICGVQISYKDASTRTTLNSEKIKEFFARNQIDITPYLNVSNTKESISIALAKTQKNHP